MVKRANYPFFALNQPKMATIEMHITDLAERCGVLCRQQEQYGCDDYLSFHHQLAMEQKKLTKSPANYIIAYPTTTGNSCTSSSKSSGINELWREKICEWNFQVVDHYDISREIAFISLNYLDRYLSARPVNRKTFQLVAMTSLYLAIKLYDHTPISMSSFVELSHGYFKTEHIAAMESSILWTLSWRVHPPTPLSFVRNFILLLEESDCAPTVALEVMEAARFVTELSVCDYYFTSCKPSWIALGSVLTAFESFDEITLPMHVRVAFLKYVQSMRIIDPSSKDVILCKERLSEIYSQDTDRHQHYFETSKPSDRGCLSPYCVADISLE